MQISDLDFQFPEELIATEKKWPARVMMVDEGGPIELSPAALLNHIEPEDLLVVNNTKVIKARVFSLCGFEILFVEPLRDNQWRVLCPARQWPKKSKVVLPGDIEVHLIQRGLPQIVALSRPLDVQYFEQYGQWPLPPYILEKRGKRSSEDYDQEMYQPAWAEHLGSLASPTASLHFSKKDLSKVQARGCGLAEVTLHVGLGTFLPIHCEDLKDHVMHEEQVHVSHSVWRKIQETRARGGRVWALGSTVLRTLESVALGGVPEGVDGFSGSTSLFICPGYEFKIVDTLMTNFHQPRSTLLAMVMAFAGQQNVLDGYRWAIERRFRLFSYGDLSVWHLSDNSN